MKEREKKQRNGHVKVNVDFWMIDDSDEIVSLNGDQRRTTNLNIKRVIGTYEDFVLIGTFITEQLNCIHR